LTGYGADRATKALTGKGLFSRAVETADDLKSALSPSGGSDKTPSKSDDHTSDNTSGNPKQNSEHGDSFQKDIKNYTQKP